MAKKNQNLKRDRFINVAGRRVQKVLDSLDSLSKCANRNNYDFNEEDILKMTKAIKEKLDYWNHHTPAILKLQKTHSNSKPAINEKNI